MNKRILIKYKLDGENWERTQPIRVIAIGLMELDNLMERASVTLEGKKRISQDHRRSQLVATSYRMGSFEVDLELFVASSLSTASPKDILDLVKNGFDVLKFFITSVGKKEIPQINNNGDQNTVITGSGNVCNISNNVFNFIINSEKELEQLGALFEKEGVTSTTIKSENLEGDVEIDNEFGSALAQNKLYDKIRKTYNKANKLNFNYIITANKFKPEKIVFKEDIDVKGNIVQFNKVKGQGIVTINLNKAIAEGEYEFEIKDYSMNNSLISAMMEREVYLKVQGIYKRDNKVPDKLIITTIL